MENTAQWIMIAGWLAVGATFTHHYKTGLALFVAAFALAMLPPGQVHADPLAVGVIVFYGAAALMGGYILLQIWRWMGKAGW
jgi:hypothetical protein